MKKGERIGTAKDHRCIYRDDDGEPYLRLQLFRRGKPVDPTYHLNDCKRFVNLKKEMFETKLIQNIDLQFYKRENT